MYGKIVLQQTNELLPYRYLLCEQGHNDGELACDKQASSSLFGTLKKKWNPSSLSNKPSQCSSVITMLIYHSFRPRRQQQWCKWLKWFRDYCCLPYHTPTGHRSIPLRCWDFPVLYQYGVIMNQSPRFLKDAASIEWRRRREPCMVPGCCRPNSKYPEWVW